MNIILTGCAGFIGMHTALRLLQQGHQVVGIDNLNDYYDVMLKEKRLTHLTAFPNFKFYKINIADQKQIAQCFANEQPQRVVHLAAQAGVRYSLVNPHAYIESNIQGFMNILEGCRQNQIEHLVYASSSSVYGGNTQVPFIESQNNDHPLSLYAATKKSNELMAHTYSHLFALPTTGLRFFTVYGPWGRPDMALFKFTRAILSDEAIDIYNYGNMVRDFTYIDDIVEGILRVTAKPACAAPEYDSKHSNPAISSASYRIFNIGNSAPVSLMDYITVLEQALGKEAKKNFLPMQAGDVPETAANIDALEQWTGFKPTTSILHGIQSFVDWYRNYYLV